MESKTAYPAEGRYALAHHKTLRPLLGSAVKIWLSKPSVFILSALVVILPMELLFTGALGGGFNDPEGLADDTWTAIDSLAVGFLGVALITAAHARAVVALAAGERVSTLSALRLGGGAFLPVLGAAILSTLAIIAGMIALIIPGIYLSVVLVFVTQIAALTRSSIGDSFSASIALVRAAGWWRTFGYLILFAVLSLLPAFVVAIPIVALSELAGDASVSGPIAVVLGGVILAVIYSFTALLQSLLYFSYRAKVGDPWGQGTSDSSPDSGSAPGSDAGPDWDPANSAALGHGA